MPFVIKYWIIFIYIYVFVFTSIVSFNLLWLHETYCICTTQKKKKNGPNDIEYKYFFIYWAFVYGLPSQSNQLLNKSFDLRFTFRIEIDYM